MSDSARKQGWCPSLMRPMETGDGLLVRINNKAGVITALQARAIAMLAERHGNGHIDLTSRGNLQLRGVTEENYPLLVEKLVALGFTEEDRTPRPEAGAIALGIQPEGLVLGLPFGRMVAAQLEWLADIAEVIKLTPWRAVLLPGVTSFAQEALVRGFLLDSNDARRAIQACPGAPACHAGEGDTRELALAIAKALPGLVSAGKSVHVSGCAKGCAMMREADMVVVARAGEYAIAYNAKADAVTEIIAPNVKAVIEELKIRA